MGLPQTDPRKVSCQKDRTSCLDNSNNNNCDDSKSVNILPCFRTPFSY